VSGNFVGLHCESFSSGDATRFVALLDQPMADWNEDVALLRQLGRCKHGCCQCDQEKDPESHAFAATLLLVRTGESGQRPSARYLFHVVGDR